MLFSRRQLMAVTTAISTTLIPLLAPVARLAPVASAAPPNAIQAENMHTGTTGWIIRKPSYHHEIEGYASATSVAPGGTISFSVSTKAQTFRADIYRLGWYQGKGARLMRTYHAMPGHLRAIPAPDSSDGLVDCRWAVSFRETVPKNWVTGMYIVKLTASDAYQAYIPFVVRGHVPNALLFVHAVNTDEAYNTWGGKSLYVDLHYRTAETNRNRAYMVSFARPFFQDAGAGQLFWWEYPAVRWLEKRGYPIDYATDVDIDQQPTLTRHRPAVLIVGHSEYWSMRMRDNIHAAIDSGVDLGVLGANTAYFQIRYEPLEGKPNRVIVCYKVASLDPLDGKDDPLVTVPFRSPPVNLPETQLLGEGYASYVWDAAPTSYVVTDPSSWVFAGTGVHYGSSVRGIVGYEYDAVDPSLLAPANVQVLSDSPVANSFGLASHSNSTVYDASSGAVVFDAGSIDWSFGLDNFRPSFSETVYKVRPSVASAIAKRITANVLSRFLTSKTALSVRGAVRRTTAGNRQVFDAGERARNQWPGRAISKVGVALNVPTNVWGQPGFRSAWCSYPATRASLCSPVQSVIDSHGNMWVADTGDNRVLFYPYDARTRRPSRLPTRVFGQAGSFSSSQCNRDTSSLAIASKATLCLPEGISVDKNETLYVADSFNNRILIFLHADQSSQVPKADVVLGQPSFVETGPNDHPPSGPCSSPKPASACTLSSPGELNIDNGRLFAADSGNNRILEWSTSELTRPSNGRCAMSCDLPAGKVWGQYGSFTGDALDAHPSTTAGQPCAGISGVNACNLNDPTSAVADGHGDLFIADSGNDRVLFIPNAMTSDRQSAAIVYGQTNNFTSSAQADGRGMYRPYSLALDNRGQLWVVDMRNYRLLRFPKAAPTAATSPVANAAIGYPYGYDTQNHEPTPNRPSRSILWDPTSVSVDANGRLFVTDRGDSRVLLYRSQK